MRTQPGVALAQTATIVPALAGFTGLEALWVSRAPDRVYAALDRIEARLDRVEGVVLRDLGERVARLEAARD